MKVSVESARQFVASVEIVPPRGGADVRGGSTLAENFDAAKDQSTVVGGEVFSFVTGVSAQARDAIVNSALLAQLVAKKKVPNPDDADGWYNTYFDTLTNLGWVIQERQFAQYQETESNFDAHKAILAVVATVLGPAAAALTIVTSTINALHSMNEEQPWIALFNRESRVGKIGRFQISLVNQDENQALLVTLMAFSMTAKAALTQVLFFRAKAGDVTLRHTGSKVTIASEVLAGALPAIKQKLAGHIADSIAMMDI